MQLPVHLSPGAVNATPLQSLTILCTVLRCHQQRQSEHASSLTLATAIRRSLGPIKQDTNLSTSLRSSCSTVHLQLHLSSSSNVMVSLPSVPLVISGATELSHIDYTVPSSALSSAADKTFEQAVVSQQTGARGWSAG